MNWTPIIITLWLALFAWSDRYSFLPATHWIDVHTLAIYDGECPTLDLSREIHRKFNGHWYVAIDEKQGDGWHLVGQWEGFYPYTTDVKIINRDLKWLTADESVCDTLPPGEYRARVNWRVLLGNGDTKTERITSNAFVKI